MKCAKCGQNLQDGAKYCSVCGAATEFAPRQSAPAKPKFLIHGIVALAAVALVAIIVVFAATRSNVMTAPGAPPSPMPNAPGVAKPKPPQSLVAYLEHVKKVEEQRQFLLKDTQAALSMSGNAGQAQTLINMIDMAMDPDGAEAKDPLAGVKSEIARQYSNWAELLKYFDKYPAPAEAREFSGAYRDVVYKEALAIGKIAAGFQKVDISDPQSLQKLLKSMQGMKADKSIQGNIDKSVEYADGWLDSTVAKYDMPKPFTVEKEQKTGGGIMGF